MKTKHLTKKISPKAHPIPKKIPKIRRKVQYGDPVKTLEFGEIAPEVEGNDATTAAHRRALRCVAGLLGHFIYLFDFA